jgi:hypothetical protein
MVVGLSKVLRSGVGVAMVVAFVAASGCGGSSRSTATARAGASGAESTSATTRRTRVVYVRPTTRQGALRPGYKVSGRRAEGRCTGSEAATNGFRCSARSGLYPWCWPLGRVTTARAVVCADTPWERTVTKITLSERLRPNPRERAEPAVLWGVQLTTGQRCVTVPGKGEEFNGAIIRFGCAGAPADLELLGEPAKTRAPWQIREIHVYSTKESRPRYMHGPIGLLAVAWYPVAPGR